MGSSITEKMAFLPRAVGDDDVSKGTVVVGELEPLGGRVGPIPDLAERHVRLSGDLPYGRLCMGAVEVTDAATHHGFAGAWDRPRKTQSRRDRRARVIRTQRVDLRTKIQFPQVRRWRQVHGFGRHRPSSA